MFSPIGYTSFAKLWREFTTNHFVHIYSKAADDYAAPHSARSINVGSPADICERIFLKSFLDYRVVVAKDTQRIARVDVALDRQFNSIYTMASVFESTRIATNPNEAGANGEFLKRFGSIRFSSWEQEHDDPRAWNEAYPRLSSSSLGQINIECARFHTLPFVFERLQFVVPDAAPPWARDAFHSEYVDRFTKEFPGWSFCLCDGDFSDWAKSCPNCISEFFTSEDAPPKSGRPPKVGEAIKAIQQIYQMEIPNESHKEVRRKVEAVIDIAVSESTIKRAIKKLKKQANTGV